MQSHFLKIHTRFLLPKNKGKEALALPRILLNVKNRSNALKIAYEFIKKNDSAYCKIPFLENQQLLFYFNISFYYILNLDRDYPNL